PTGLAVPVIPVLKVPPEGLTTIWYGANTLQSAGIVLIVGVGGFTAVTATVFVIGQFTTLGVTTTVYTIVVCVPIGMFGQMIVEEYVLALPARYRFGVQE